MGPSTLDPNAESGRNLFYSATLPQMAASGAGVSCSTCHFDARNDGLTWAFTTGDRQTPSLAGQVLHTAPVTWTANVDSVASEATITSQGRMGGDELTYTQALQIQSFAGSIRPPILPLQGSEDPAVVRGQAIFEREDVACASCHDPANTFQDGASHKMFGLDNVNTPTLVGVGATAPYLHNGRAETLMDVLELSRSGEMGNTSSLSEEEMADLEAYLLSL
jgi:cytochrome c peroxidase